MSNKSPELQLKEAIEATLAKTQAFSEKMDALASENNTYTERMKKMEDGLTSAMSKVLEMDASIKDFHKQMQGKLGDMEKKFAGVIPPEESEKEENEESPAEEEKETPEGKKAAVEKQDPELEKQEEKVKQDLDGDKEEGESKEHKEKVLGKPEPKADEGAGNSVEGVNKKLNTVEKGVTMGGKKKKSVEKIGEPVNEKYDEEKKAEELTPAPVAQEVSVIEALSAKVEAVLQKLASATVQAPVAQEIPSAKLALETKAKEETVSHFKALNEKFEALMAKVGSLEKSASTVETKAAQIVSSTGIDAPVALGVDSASASATETDESAFKQFESLSGAEQRKFYLANKSKIERHASALLRTKRS